MIWLDGPLTKTYLKYGGLENCTCDQAGFFYECEMQRQGTRQQVLKNGAQSAGYLWPGKFFPAHLLFVLNVFFFPKREEELSDYTTSAATEWS